MFKPLFCLLIPLLLFFCDCKSQNITDKAKADSIFKETIPLFPSFLWLQKTNVDSANLLCKILIDKYQLIYRLDTTSKSVGDFFSDCYRFNKDYDKQIFWVRHQLSLNKKPLDKMVYFGGLAQAFLCLGILDSSKYYFEKTFRLQKELGYQTQIVTDFIYFADNVYLQKDKGDLKILNTRITSTCKYSIEILKFLLPYLKDNTAYIQKPFNMQIINDRQKNCRQK